MNIQQLQYTYMCVRCVCHQLCAHSMRAPSRRKPYARGSARLACVLQNITLLNIKKLKR